MVLSSRGAVWLATLAVPIVAVTLSVTRPQISRADDAVQFNRDIRPLLADKCFRCHGPDENGREAELRLDEETSAKADRDGSFVIRPGGPQQSTLLERVVSDDDDLRMPPPDAGEPFDKALLAYLDKRRRVG